jgi:hypothetical protein
MLGLVLFSLTSVGVASLPTTVRAQTGDSRLQWSEEWRRASVGELVAAGVLATTAIMSDLRIVPEEARMRGGALFDDPLRDALRLEGAADRRAARTASDVLLYSLILWSPLLDSGLASGLVDENEDVSWQTLEIDITVYAATLFITQFSKNIGARDRPFVPDCDTPNEDDAVDCDGRDRHRSFFSGHAAFAFAGASLVCVHHANLPLYSHDAADNGACVGAMLLAAATGVLRILGDMHYATDVLLGAIIGLAAGLLLPAALHYGFDWNRDEGRYVPPMI